MVREHPIVCPHCKQNSGYTQESLMFFVLTHDLVCQHCGKVVVKANIIELNDKYHIANSMELESNITLTV